MEIINTVHQSLASMTHTELMLTGIFTCLLVQTLFQITGRMSVYTKSEAGMHCSSPEIANKSLTPVPIHGKAD